jgi:hypothetical protein
MNKIISKINYKLFFKKWVVGICRGDIKDIIRTKTFDPDINWILLKPYDRYYADPFFLIPKDENIKLLLEEFTLADDYGRLSLMTFDKNYRPIKNKIILDTKSHLSYPFLFTEDNKTYIFPEAGQSGKLSCYEYDYDNESLIFCKDIIELPLVDSTILKKDGKYWIFGSVNRKDKDYELFVFHSDSLLGPYISHPCNPVSKGIDGIRSAGNFIEVDGIIYRPAQNCKIEYGESMTINKIVELNENNVAEEPYMTISINRHNKCNNGIHNIHTINVMDDIIVVDGIKWSFSPIDSFKEFLRNRAKSVKRLNASQ